MHLFYQHNTARVNTLDAVGETPTASTLSGVFSPEILASKTIDASRRLARFEPARSHLPAGALFDPAPASAKWCGSFKAGALFQIKKGTASSDMEKEGLAHRRRGDGR